MQIVSPNNCPLKEYTHATVLKCENGFHHNLFFGHVTIPTLRSVIHHLDKSDKSTLLYIYCFCKKILWIYTKENLQKPSNFLKGYEREYFHLFHQPKLLIWKTADSGEDTKIKTLPYYCC